MPKVPTRFREIIVPEALFDVAHAAHERAAAPYQSVAQRIAGGVKPSSTQPVYLSRRLLPSPNRALIGEAELEDVLRENGFLVVNPETMTFEDQVRLVNAHTDLFSSTGSAAHTILFALHHPRLHLLAGGGTRFTSFKICSHLVAAPTAVVRCLDGGERSDGDYARWLPDVVRIPRLVEYLDERGLVKTRHRAALTGRNPALREEYDEAWFYASVAAAFRDDEALPDTVAREAEDFARRSWPVSLALAELYLKQRDAARFRDVLRQFAALAAAESDLERLVRYRADVQRVAGYMVKVTRPPATTALVDMV